MSDFFIKRPIITIVISIFIVFVGLFSLQHTPVSKYPEICPPNVQISAEYAGVNAVDVEQAVTTPIEQQINGVENQIYIKSVSLNGSALMDVSFEVGTDLDIADTRIRNSISRINPFLPAEVTGFGIDVKKSLNFPLLLFSVYSPANTFDAGFINNYSVINLVDELKRVKGVGGVSVMGSSEYAMRIWLKPDRLAALKIIPADLIKAIKGKNNIIPGGSFGNRPAVEGTQHTYTAILQQRLTSEEQFKNIIIKSNENGAVVRLKDVATVELGLQGYDLNSYFNGNPCAAIAVYQTPGANGLDVAHSVKTKIEELKERFPLGLDYKTSLDTTEEVSDGIDEVWHTLFEAGILVIVAVSFFLQNWRAALVTLMVVPISVIGTFIAFPLLGYSVNQLSLLGMVLAIALIVDDSIEVVEAIIHEMEHGQPPIKATHSAMKMVSGSIIATAFIRFAIFIPLALAGGVTGRLYQQFAVTIIISVAFSAFIALTLSPALSALLLKPKSGNNRLLNRFFRRFNYFFEKLTNKYVKLTRFATRRLVFSVALLAIITLFAALLSKQVHKELLPEEDEGYFMLSIQLPDAASMDRTEAVSKKVQALFKNVQEIKSYTSVNGFNILSNVSASNVAMAFIALKPWHERKKTASQIIDEANKMLAKYAAEATVTAFAPSPIQGLGTSAGFTMMLQDREGNGPQYLEEQARNFISAASKRREIGNIFCLYRASIPQKSIEVDEEKVQKLGIPLQDVNEAFSQFLSGAFVNNFNSFGHQYRTYIQADAAYRMRPDNINQFFVRDLKGNMISLGTLAKVKDTAGPAYTNHFNIYRAAEVLGVPAKGFSAFDALKALEETAKATLPPAMAYQWSDISYQEKEAEQKDIAIIAVSLLFVFLLLAARYESWKLSFSVLLGTAWVVLGAMLGLFIGNLFGEDYVDNVFARIGLMVIIGLNTKNAMLVVEFAIMKLKQDKKGPYEAAIAAAKLRFRPTVITSLVCIAGIVPLMLASGAGAEARKVMGISVFSGMTITTVAGLILIPALFFLFGKKRMLLNEKKL